MKTLIIYWTQEGNQFFEAEGDRYYLQGIIVNVSDERKVAPLHFEEVSEAAFNASNGWKPINLADLGSLDDYRIVECGFFV